MRIRWPRLTFPPINLWDAPAQPGLEQRMSEFETVPFGTMAELERLREDRERLREERDAYQDMAQCMSSDLTSMGEERDALAAHVERLEKVLFDTYAAIEDGDPSAIPYDAARAAHNDTPTTSLARLKAEWQAEGIEEVAMDVQADYGHHTQYSVSLLAAGIEGYAHAKRRQAEEAAE